MENINLIQLLNIFISDKEILWEIRKNNIDIIDYLIKNKSYENNTDVIKNIILNSFYSEIKNDTLNELSNNLENYDENYVKHLIKKWFYEKINWNSLNELIENIQNYDESEYIDGLVDLYEKDLINSLYYFWTNLEISRDDIWISLNDLISKTQYEWYLDFFETIRNQFINFLENIKK